MVNLSGCPTMANDIGNSPRTSPTLAQRRAADAALGLLAVAGRSGRMFGTGVANYLDIAVIPMKGKAVHPGATLRISGLLAKYSPFNSGGAYRTVFRQGGNSVIVSQSSFAATLATIPLSAEMTLSHDRKWGFLKSRTQNMYGLAALVAGTYSEDIVVANAAPSAVSPRAQSVAVAFAAYSAPPTVETILINFDQDFEIAVQVGAGALDSYELLSFDIEQLSHGIAGVNFASPKATICGIDSMTEGTGATAGNDWVSVYARARPGTPVLNIGLGGQVPSQGVDRILADPIAGKYWNLIFWAVNGGSADGPAWWASLNAQIQRLIAYRDPSSRMMILNIHNSLNWDSNFQAAAAYVNAQLAATYGSIVVDVASLINGNASDYSDNTHLTDAGYAKVAAAANAKATALGWS